MASGSLPSFTVLADEDDVLGSKFERGPEEYPVGQLKRWLKCRGLKLKSPTFFPRIIGTRGIQAKFVSYTRFFSLAFVHSVIFNVHK